MKAGGIYLLEIRIFSAVAGVRLSGGKMAEGMPAGGQAGKI